jgi:hypothetical protein
MSRKRGSVEFSRQHSWFDPRCVLLKGRRSRGLDLLVFTTLSIIFLPIDPKFGSAFKTSAIKLVTQAGKSERAERQSEVPQSDIEVARNHQKVDDD